MLHAGSHWICGISQRLSIIAVNAREKCRPARGSFRYWVVLSAVCLLAPRLSYGELTHYPGAWLDTNGAATDGVVYVSGDRFERVHSFYRQFLFELPTVDGAAYFCRDAAHRPDACRRFVELRDLSGAGVGTRIRVSQSR